MEEFDLKRFAKTAWQKKIFIIIFIVISIIAGFIYSFKIVKPEYKSITTIVLTQVENTNNEQSKDSISQSDITLNNSLVDTYGEIITSKKVLKSVIENLQLDLSEDELAKKVSVSAGDTTAILTITVVDAEPEIAMNLTNEIAKVFSEQVKSIYGISNVNIIDEAEKSELPYNIHHAKDLAIFTMLGVFLSGGFVLIIYMLDTTVKQAEDIENIGLNVSGIIPLFEKELEEKIAQDRNYNKKKAEKIKETELIVLENAKSPITEAFRTLRTNIAFSNKNVSSKNILITSSNAQDGKSYITANLAIMFAKANKKVIIIDADMRRGRQNKIFNVSNSQGLANCLLEMKSDHRMNVNQVAKYIKTTKVPNLHILTSGDRPTNPAELLSASRLTKLLDVLDIIYDVVIIDGTPSSIVSDSVAMAKFVDMILIVASYKNTKVETLERVKKSIENVGGRIGGVILNKVPLPIESYIESYYYDDSKSKNINQVEQKIKTVEELISESKAIEDYVEKDTNTDMIINNQNTEISNNDSKYLEYKMENISNELANIKNLFIQAMMENRAIDPRDISDMKAEITNIKNMLDIKKDLDTSKEIRDELDSVKLLTESLVESQNDNSEKIKRFIEEYRNRNK